MSVKDDVQVAARYITPRSLLIFGLIAAVVFAYCEGKRSERAAVQSARYEQQREPQTMVPANLVVPEIKAAHAALVSDSLALLAAAATLGFATTRADLNEQRAEAAEGELKASKPSRWRFVAGVLTGVASVILLRRALK
jgi:hypothetical protein